MRQRPFLHWLEAGGSLAALPGAATVADAHTVAALDTAYQAAVMHKDIAAMERMLPDDFVLVTGKGATFGKADLLAEVRRDDIVFTHQEDAQQQVRVWGDTAVVTALLSVEGRDKGTPFRYRLWFSDVYLRTAQGWRYTFGQASLRLPGDAC